jgi:hypothetical protein
MDGELVEIRARHKTRKLNDISDAALFGQLKHVSQARGYKRGWASHKFKELRGDWPPYQIRDAPEMEPAPRVLSWIRSRQIAYARRPNGDGSVGARS